MTAVRLQSVEEIEKILQPPKCCLGLPIWNSDQKAASTAVFPFNWWWRVTISETEVEAEALIVLWNNLMSSLLWQSLLRLPITAILLDFILHCKIFVAVRNTENWGQQPLATDLCTQPGCWCSVSFGIGKQCEDSKTDTKWSMRIHWWLAGSVLHALYYFVLDIFFDVKQCRSSKWSKVSLMFARPSTQLICRQTPKPRDLDLAARSPERFKCSGGVVVVLI